ncbi:leucine-rich repeat-containing protein 3-like [Engraulis encrasicolus]|uniref:leucine-rich repeat-containing protein 3-like n=1 Tax=Engraulis encrasicolus TaxID=184585 RepID=UPI002FD71F11
MSSSPLWPLGPLIAVATQLLLGALVMSSAGAGHREPSAASIVCPESCYCSPILDRGGAGHRGGGDSEELGGVSVRCSNQLLTSVPLNLPNSTRRLYLDYNQLSFLPADAFVGLPLLSELDLSHNKLSLLEPGSLAALGRSLRTLDLSSNQLTTLDPEALGGLLSRTNLTDNPWHCDCKLQEAVPRLELEPASLLGLLCDSVTPKELETGAKGKALVLLAQETDLCAGIKRTTDVALFLVMFGWFGMVITYLVYYVRANQEDARRHLAYLKSLPKEGASDASSTGSTMV